jgi:hypothetical protein
MFVRDYGKQAITFCVSEYCPFSDTTFRKLDLCPSLDEGIGGTYSVEVEVKLRPIVSRPVRPGVRHPSGTRNQFYFLLEIFFRQLRVCYFLAPTLTRGRVCNLLLLLFPASAVPLGSESRGTQDHILLSQFLRPPQPGGPGPRIYIPQEQGGPVISPGTGFLFGRLLRLARLRWRYSIPPSHGILLCWIRDLTSKTSFLEADRIL